MITINSVISINRSESIRKQLIRTYKFNATAHSTNIYLENMNEKTVETQREHINRISMVAHISEFNLNGTWLLVHMKRLIEIIFPFAVVEIAQMYAILAKILPQDDSYLEI